MKEIAAALFKFQQEIGKISKDGKNPVYNSKYATLSNVLEIIKEPLKNAGLVVFQSPSPTSLQTQILHVESGKSIVSEFPLSPTIIVLEKTEAGKKTTTTSQDPQSVAKAITYARRYALVSMLCLDVDDDDDGNAASKPTASEQQAFKEQVKGIVSDNQSCPKCGGPMAISKAGKPYCKAVCWKKTEPSDPTDDF